MCIQTAGDIINIWQKKLKNTIRNLKSHHPWQHSDEHCDITNLKIFWRISASDIFAMSPERLPESCCSKATNSTMLETCSEHASTTRLTPVSLTAKIQSVGLWTRIYGWLRITLAFACVCESKKREIVLWSSVVSNQCFPCFQQRHRNVCYLVNSIVREIEHICKKDILRTT